MKYQKKPRIHLTNQYSYTLMMPNADVTVNPVSLAWLHNTQNYIHVNAHCTVLWSIRCYPTTNWHYWGWSCYPNKVLWVMNMFIITSTGTSTSQRALELVAKVAVARSVVLRKTYSCFLYSSHVRNFSCSAWNSRMTSPWNDTRTETAKFIIIIIIIMWS